MLIKLRNKFMIWNMTIICIVILVCFFVIYMTTDLNIQKENEEKLQSLTTKPIILYNGENKNGNFVQVGDYYNYFTIVLDDNNNILEVESFLELPYDMYSQVLKMAKEEGKSVGILRFLDRRWIYSINESAQTLINGEKIGAEKRISFLDVTESYTVLNQLLVTFFIVGAMVIVVIFFISFVFANDAIKPIAASLVKQKQFISDASHELKTPIAIINASLDALLENKENPKEITKWTNNVLSQTERMEKLIKNLLSLAKADEENIKFTLDKIDVSEVVNEVITEIEAYLFDKNIKFEEKIEPNVSTLGNYEGLKQILLILFDNAMKYTNENGSVSACLIKSKHGVVFTLENSCETITKEHLSHIFDRFYRIDQSRINDGSFGLGLPIAKSMIEKMGGEIFAESIENASVKFTVVLK